MIIIIIMVIMMIIHWKVCHNYNIKTSEKWYDHELQTVTENKDVMIL